MTEDHRLQRVAAQLAPLLALDVGLRALALSPDRVQGGGSDHDPREALSDRGELARARALTARLAQHPPAVVAVLRWIASSAHGLGVAEAAERYGRTSGPVALRDAETVALDGLDRARRGASLARAHQTQRTKAARRGIVLPPTPAETEAAGRVEHAEGEVRVARRALAAHGRAVLLGALDAWERIEAGEGEDRAA